MELYDRLKVAFPVYVMFTKADLIEGFGEFFGDLREKERRVVWGATFQTDERTIFSPSQVLLSLTKVDERLTTWVGGATSR